MTDLEKQPGERSKQALIHQILSPTPLFIGLVLGLILGLLLPNLPEINLGSSNTSSKLSGEPKDLSKTVSWYTGSQGYEKALAIQKEQGTPIFLYFYAPWCSYCGKFNLHLINQKKVQSALKKRFLNVKIYPEIDEAGFVLFRRYGASGYPAVFIKNAMGEIQEVEIFKKVAGNWMMKSQDEFIGYLSEISATP